ncbi:hypothetical protein PEC302107_14070 [Pectobacterium araliae]|nr:hypothetical protein PEC302107_14070 [Pectobacterium carotovorum subsp. carotovorum]
MNIAANKLFIFQCAVGWFLVHERGILFLIKGRFLIKGKKDEIKKEKN